MTVILTLPKKAEKKEMVPSFPFIIEYESPLREKVEYYFAYKKGDRSSEESIEVVNLETGEFTWFRMSGLGMKNYRVLKYKIELGNM